MRVHSDILTEQDLYRHLPVGVGASVDEIRRPRKRARGWIVYLRGYGERHTRANGRHNGDMAATYEDHGEWMAELFQIDPNASIGIYRNRGHFNQVTEWKFQPAGCFPASAYK
jgi:hypothetical protein